MEKESALISLGVSQASYFSITSQMESNRAENSLPTSQVSARYPSNLVPKECDFLRYCRLTL
jgi:hypothetical protein